MKSNLEPIEEGDMDLEGKLKRGESSIEFTDNRDEQVFAVEKEAPKEISAAEKDSAYGNILSKVQTQQADEIVHDVEKDAAAGAQKTDAESQVQHLVDIASQKGVVHAVKVARHMEDNYVLDTFHDRLLGEELHDALVSKGLITEL